MTPSVGRILHFYDPKYSAGPQPAIVTYVHQVDVVDVRVFSPAGSATLVRSVLLIEEPDGDDHDGANGHFCTWPPREG